MALSATQYLAVKRQLRSVLSGTPYVAAPNLTEAGLLSFWAQLMTDSIGATALTQVQVDQIDKTITAVLSPSITVLSSLRLADWVDFISQIGTESSGASSLPAAQYAAHEKQLRAVLSGRSASPMNLSTADLKSYLSPYAALPAAPALFLAGQSNAGNVDTTPGTSDARVSLTWSPDGTTFTGPGAMALQSGGHSFEWQCATNMAVAFNSNIKVAKTWADGTPISTWVASANGYWIRLAKTLEVFALQCIAANITQVEFGWCQGESNAIVSASASLATFQSDTNSVFDSVKYLLEGFGLTVHFTILKTNANLTTGVAPTDTSAASLAAIRGYQDALALARSDTATLSFDSVTPIGGLHYQSGQTNTLGALWATAIIARYTGAQPALTTPPTVEAIMGAAVLFDYDSRSITGLVAGDPVSTWPDIGGGARTLTAAGGVRPAYRVNAIGAIPEVEFDGTDDIMIVPGVSLPAPATTPFYSLWIGRQKTWTSADRIWGSTTGFFSLYQGGGSPQIAAYGGSASGGFQTDMGMGVFGKVENYFSNSVTDDMRVIDTVAVTFALGNDVPGALSLGACSGTAFSNVTFVRWIGCNAQPTKVQRDKLRGYWLKNYGSTVCGVL